MSGLFLARFGREKRAKARLLETRVRAFRPVGKTISKTRARLIKEHRYRWGQCDWSDSFGDLDR
jgi:hypothetical protein